MHQDACNCLEPLLSFARTESYCARCTVAMSASNCLEWPPTHAQRIALCGAPSWKSVSSSNHYSIMPSERRVRTQEEILRDSGTPKLPVSGKITLSGDAAGVPTLLGIYDVGEMMELIAQLEGARASGRKLLQDQIQASLQAADVAALSVARPCQGWNDLIEDLRLWHVVRLVFQGIPLPWKAGDSISGSFSTTPSPGCMEIVQPDGRVKYLAPPAGAVLQVRKEPGITRIVAVWPDGREQPCVSMVKEP